MADALVIVESPAKAKSIARYLGKNYQVKASVGHVIDLPKSKLGVDVEHDFEPTYDLIQGKKNIVDDLSKSAARVEHVILATDPDREGEAIAFHIVQEIEKRLQKKKKAPPRFSRVLFNAITKSTVLESIQNPGELNRHLFEAQQGRRILDRLVGYKVSPILWEKVQRGLSAGRVQSVAVRLVVEREEAIEVFKPEEYWSLEIELEGSQKPTFLAKFAKWKGKNRKLTCKEDVEEIKTAAKGQPYLLEQVIKKERKRHPTPPFITSTLQQEAARKLGFSAKQTMREAQRLYEGIEIKSETVGLITYMRTDSVRIEPGALHAVRDYIKDKYGDEFLPAKPRFFKSKKSAQDAHECVRPASVAYPPERVKAILDKKTFKLYELIWKRFVASQMEVALYDQTTFEIQNVDAQFRATGSILKFAGFTQVYFEGIDEPNLDDDDKKLPDLKEGEELKLLDLKQKQHFTEPPPRFSEASLVKTLEELGIGRPSTYAAIMSTIVDKKYVERKERRFYPTTLGRMVNALLCEHFKDLLDVNFTAKMENQLDEIEEGKRDWVKTLKEFYTPFEKTLEVAKKEMKNIKRQEIATDFKCEKCGEVMVIKWGKHGEFLACSAYPDCKNTKEIEREAQGTVKIKEEPKVEEKCDKCGAEMLLKRGRYGEFLACSKYPDCKSTKPITIGVNCPECAKPMAQKQSKRGKIFYACTGYPDCKYALWDRPVKDKTCPTCKHPFLVEKYLKNSTVIKCPKEGCGYQVDE